jgi:hypothetical protein
MTIILSFLWIIAKKKVQRALSLGLRSKLIDSILYRYGYIYTRLLTRYIYVYIKLNQLIRIAIFLKKNHGKLANSWIGKKSTDKPATGSGPAVPGPDSRCDSSSDLVSAYHIPVATPVPIWLAPILVLYISRIQCRASDGDTDTRSSCFVRRLAPWGGSYRAGSAAKHRPGRRRGGPPELGCYTYASQLSHPL